MSRSVNIPGRVLAGWPGADSPGREVSTLKSSGAGMERLRRLLEGRVPQKLILTMTSQLATMLGAGCDLCAGLETMARQQPHPRLKRIIQDLYEAVKSGQAFSQALAKHPDVFDTAYVTMVRAGETAGLMRSMLGTLQQMIRSQIRVVSSVRAALLYPCILTTVALGAIGVMTMFVLPRFAEVFRSAHVALPTPTRILLGVSAFAGQHALWLLMGMVALAGVIVWVVNQGWAKPYTHAWYLKVPLLGKALQLSYVVRSLQALAMLVKAGLPLAEALVLVGDMVPNIYYRRFFEEVREHIGEGKQLSPDFERTELFPPMVGQMMSVGEQTGTLANVCGEVAGYLEEELQERIKIVTTALEPIIIVGLGGVVGFIAVSVILPMFRISSALK